MATELDSPTLGRGADWGGFYDQEPFEANDPFSPTAFGQLLFSQPDAASALALLGLNPGAGTISFADISGTISIDQLPTGSLVSVDSIDADALYFFDNSAGVPRLISGDEAASFIAASLSFSDIGGTIGIDQFPEGTTVSIDSIDEDGFYFFDNVNFVPKLLSRADTITFLDLSFGDVTGTLSIEQLPPGTAATIEPIDEDALFFFDDSAGLPLLISASDAVAFLLPDQTGNDTKFLQTNAGILSWAAASGGSGDVASDSIWDAKGDLAVGTGADTAAKLTAGSNDTILMADSAQTTGLKWGAPSTVRTALGLVIGTNVQAYDADLDTWATKTPYAGTLTITTGKTFDVQNNLTLTATDGSTLAIGAGGTLGTAAYTASGAYQPIDSDLTTIAGLTATTDNFIVSVASAWASRTPSQVRTTLGLVIGTNVQAWDADLDTLAGLTATTDNFIVSVSNAWASRTPTQVKTTLGLTIGTNVQAWDADLDALAALNGTNTIYYRSAADTWTAVTIGSNLTFSAGTLDATAGGSVSDTAYDATTWNGVTTTAPSKNAVRDKFETLRIGTDVQAWDADLDTLAGLTATTDNFIVSVSSAWASRTPAQVRTTLGLVNTRIRSVGFTIKNAAGIPTGKVPGFFTCPFAGTIAAYNIVADAGTCTIKTWKIATGTAKPTSSNSISTSGVQLATGTAIHSTTVSDFSTTVTANDIFAFNIEAISGMTELTFNLEIDTSA